jgi:hypothetical protein
MIDADRQVEIADITQENNPRLLSVSCASGDDKNFYRFVSTIAMEYDEALNVNRGIRKSIEASQDLIAGGRGHSRAEAAASDRAFAVTVVSFESLKSKKPVAMDFLSEVESLAVAQQLRPAMKSVFNHFTRWMLQGNWDTCDTVFELANVEAMGIDISLSFLTITMPAREHFKQRSAFMDRLRQHVIKTRDRRVADRLLANMV